MAEFVSALPMFSTFLITLTTTVVIITSFIFMLLKMKYRFWKRHGVPGPQPKMFIGNMAELIQQKMTEPQLLDLYYKKYNTEKYIGLFNLWSPSLLIRNTEIAKRIMENDFEYFTDHPAVKGKVQSDSIVNSLFTMKGDIWKSRRPIFGRLFTPKKMKEYFDYTDDSLSSLLDVLGQKLNQDIEIFELLKRNFVKTMCLILFGLDVSKDDETVENIIECTEVLSKPTLFSAMKFFFYSVSPKLFNLLKVRIFPLFVWKYISNFTKKLISSRKQMKEKNNDLLQLIIHMMEEGITEGEKINLEEAIGHVYSFFEGSHMTSEMTICHTLLLLASHPEVQKKLIEEIDSVTGSSKKITYEHLSQMEYLEAVISESLRMFPVSQVLKRVCNKTYKLDDKFTVPEGMDVLIPIGSFQRDPENYPEPDKFKPDRYYNKESSPSSLMTFGKGPRACIGKKLGMLSVKLIIARILLEYVILTSDRMMTPMKFDIKSLFITVRPIGGFWIKLKKRDY